MTDETQKTEPTIVVKSSRFGELTVPVSSIIEVPGGLIGFPNLTRYVMFEHKPPFSWLHAVDDQNLAFVVVDGFEFGKEYDVKPPLNEKETDFKKDEEFAILVIVTVRSDPRMTTANLKAPVFVNMRNRKGVQVIIDDARFSTRHPLWSDNPDSQGGEGAESPAVAEPAKEPEKK